MHNLKDTDECFWLNCYSHKQQENKCMKEATVEKRAYTEQETAEYIGMSRSFLRQSRMDGHRKNRTVAPPFIKIGRAVRYLKEDLDNWLDKQQKLERLPVGGWLNE
jgi:predicted DNA-binding transcriptional regulator AlpA